MSAEFAVCTVVTVTAVCAVSAVCVVSAGTTAVAVVADFAVRASSVLSLHRGVKLRPGDRESSPAVNSLDTLSNPNRTSPVGLSQLVSSS